MCFDLFLRSITNFIIPKNKMTQEERERLFQGLFQGANLHNPQINIIIELSSKVMYKEIALAKEEKPQVTDIHIANAIRAINGRVSP